MVILRNINFNFVRCIILNYDKKVMKDFNFVYEIGFGCF